ncbi:thioredoxin family protein [Kaistella polysaccharea]|uniref:thioredoxin family protein n=1 Tax=Kaistella polysaccharea TaxID=2878534 RepID=UPI001CF585C8|nr:thioredoxin family protein [Kaistella polysaccharea]
MKKIILFLFILSSTLTFAQVTWLTLDQALTAQAQNPKKILIDFYADWCSNCQKMEKSTFDHQVISKYINENYYPVKFNAEGRDSVTVFGRTFNNPGFIVGKNKNTMHEFTKYMNVNAVPSVVFLNEEGNPITILHGALTARELEPYLNFIAKDDFKKITTRDQWESYQKKFKSKIKD